MKWGSLNSHIKYLPLRNYVINSPLSPQNIRNEMQQNRRPPPPSGRYVIFGRSLSTNIREARDFRRFRRLTFREWPQQLRFSQDLNERQKTRKIFYPQKFLPITYHGILVYHVDKCTYAIFSVRSLMILYCECKSSRGLRLTWYFSLWMYLLVLPIFYYIKE